MSTVLGSLLLLAVLVPGHDCLLSTFACCRLGAPVSPAAPIAGQRQVARLPMWGDGNLTAGARRTAVPVAPGPDRPGDRTMLASTPARGKPDDAGALLEHAVKSLGRPQKYVHLPNYRATLTADADSPIDGVRHIDAVEWHVDGRYRIETSWRIPEKSPEVHRSVYVSATDGIRRYYYDSKAGRPVHELIDRSALPLDTFPIQLRLLPYVLGDSTFTTNVAVVSDPGFRREGICVGLGFRRTEPSLSDSLVYLLEPATCRILAAAHPATLAYSYFDGWRTYGGIRLPTTVQWEWTVADGGAEDGHEKAFGSTRLLKFELPTTIPDDLFDTGNIRVEDP